MLCKKDAHIVKSWIQRSMENIEEYKDINV